MRDALYQNNRESFELWLVTRAHRISTKPPSHPDEASGSGGTRVKKRASTPNQDLTWLEAISQPDAQESNQFFERALREMEKHPVRVVREAYRMLWTVYIGPSPDESLPEFWRRRANDKERNDPFDTIYAELLESAFDFVLEAAREEKRLLYWPTPEGASGYIDENARKHREARYHYLRERDAGTPVTEAVKRAARNSRASEQAVWYWKKHNRWDGNLKPDVQSLT